MRRLLPILQMMTRMVLMGRGSSCLTILCICQMGRRLKRMVRISRKKRTMCCLNEDLKRCLINHNHKDINNHINTIIISGHHLRLILSTTMPTQITISIVNLLLKQGSNRMSLIHLLNIQTCRSISLAPTSSNKCSNNKCSTIKIMQHGPKPLRMVTSIHRQHLQGHIHNNTPIQITNNRISHRRINRRRINHFSSNSTHISNSRINIQIHIKQQCHLVRDHGHHNSRNSSRRSIK
mmetsp:Transcript_21104/g.42225  ORF Transcript_21104/g.42225 Transcript_21104/m.42225 type:complete len:236 (-) Transcript_21104:1527-2234(-)